MQIWLAESEGVYAEPSSVLPLAAIKILRERDWIQPGETVVALVTSSGLKDPQVSASLLPAAPAIEPTLDSLARALHEAYGYRL